jgi:DNA helicase-2/ATP-dependent DNA helicase PcrA
LQKLEQDITWLDVETTGVDSKKDHIIELAALHEDKEGLIETFHIFVKPQVKPVNYDEVADMSHGISWEKLEKEGLTQIEAFQAFKDFLTSKISPFNKYQKTVFAAYNASFDKNFIYEFFNKYRTSRIYPGNFFHHAHLDILSTVGLAVRHNLLPRLENFKNETVANHFGIEFNAHSAIEDIQASRQVQLELEKLLKIG